MSEERVLQSVLEGAVKQHAAEVEKFRPMLAADCDGDVSKLRFPCVASPKIDGIRCVVRGGKALTRSLKPIPNAALRKRIESLELEGVDGELVIDGATFQDTTSAVMSHEGDSSKVRFRVFDCTFVPDSPFHIRFVSAQILARTCGANDFVVEVPHILVNNEAELLGYEADVLAEGYEGVMLRDPNGKYKHGRSTLKEGGLVKLKRFADAEAVIVGFEERMHNANEAYKDELGRTKRSSAQAGKVGRGDLGAFVLQMPDRVCLNCCGDGHYMSDDQQCVCLFCNGGGKQLFTCGSGLTDEQRRFFWARQPELLGMHVKYKHLPHGAKDAPRHPVFLGIRAAEDM